MRLDRIRPSENRDKRLPSGGSTVVAGRSARKIGLNFIFSPLHLLGVLG
jgi:hypothetical protein